MNKRQTLSLWTLLLLAAIPIFYNLGGPSIYIWDEAIYANNALEMAMNGDPLVLKNKGEISLYNSKPPFVIWLQCLAIKTLGPTEWAIRLPSAFAAFFTILLLFFFARHSLKDNRIGFVAVLTLVTSPGYIRTHVVRSGDLDAVLIFWIVFYTLLAFHYLLHHTERHKSYFTLIGMGVLFAFLSKSVAGLMPLLGLALAALVAKKLGAILKKPYLYIVALSVAGLCLGYYLLRENLAPGYLEKVIDSEYRRFSENIMPWHEQPFWFYLKNMWAGYFFKPFLLLLPMGILWSFGKGTIHRVIGQMLLVFCGTYFLLISYPAVKLNYYDAPLYPFLALMIGVIGVNIVDRIGAYWQLESRMKNIFFVTSLCLIFILPYKDILQKISTQPLNRLEREGHAIRLLEQAQPTLKSYTVLMPAKEAEHTDQANFYIQAGNHFKGKEINMVSDRQVLKNGDRVLCCQQAQVDSLQRRFVIEEEGRPGNCSLFTLQKKDSSSLIK